MIHSARFESFNLSRQGDEVVYGGRTEDGSRVEIRQPVGDMDVVLVLAAHVLGRTLAAVPPEEQAHGAQAVTAKPAGQGGVLLSLTGALGVIRHFLLDADLAIRLSGAVADAARRSRLRIVS